MKNSDSKTQIIIAVIAAAAVIISALISLQAAREPVLIIISATQTAKAELIFTPTVVNIASTMPSIDTPTAINGTATATPEPLATIQPINPAQTNDGIPLDYLPVVQFNSKSYFIFSIIVGALVFIYLLMPNFEKPFGLNWIIYFSMIVFYYFYLYENSKITIYNSILFVALTLGIGMLAYKSRQRIPVEFFRTSFFHKTMATIFILPLSFSIIIAGWLQMDLLALMTDLFSWNMTAYVIFFAITHIDYG